MLCNKLNQLGKFNFCSLKVRTNCNWDLDKLENWLFDYEDKMLVNYLRYGFAISHFDLKGSKSIPKNWPGAVANKTSLANYFQVELKNKAVMGLFEENPFNCNAFYSPLNTRDKKDSMEKKIIFNMSFPKGNSINDRTKKDQYLDEKISLKYPTVDNLVEIVRNKGCGCMLLKISEDLTDKF